MSKPWLSIPLEDYEGHMGTAEVGQLTVLAELFRYVLERQRPESVAIVGVAGGNGLEAIDPLITKRIVGVDINRRYLKAVEQRFSTLAGLQLHCCDLTIEAPELAPVTLVHAALLFEHTGLNSTLDNVLSLVAPGGMLSVVLQLPTSEAEDVAPTKYTSLQSVKQDFALIDVTGFQLQMASKGFQLIEEDERPLPAGKAFWLGLFRAA